jgi:dihydrofolate reductase
MFGGRIGTARPGGGYTGRHRIEGLTMRLAVHTFITLDGVMQSPGGPEEDPAGGFDLGGWQGPLYDEATGRIIHGWFTDAEAFLLGRKTYDIFAAYWPSDDAPEGLIAEKLNELPKYVASRGTPDLEWRNAHLLGPHAVAAVRELKERPGGELQVYGSGDLVQTLLGADLVDELRLITYPVVLGKGRRLFATNLNSSAWRLAESATTPSGAVPGVYRFHGRPTFGSL